MAKPLTPHEHHQVVKAVADAELGRATLEQLAKAHTIAEGAEATKTVGLLRDHIRRMTPSPPYRNEAKSILMGCISGVITWFILGRTRDAAS